MKVKKFLSALIAGAMLLGLTAIPAFAADEGLVKDSDGAYIIEDYDDLKYFGTNIDKVVPSGANVTVKLENDIDLTGKEWTPIVMNNSVRTLVFEGQGHTLKNMKANVAKDKSTGFFGNVENSIEITIKDLTIDSAEFCVAISEKGDGIIEEQETAAGAFIGWSETKNTVLENCKVTNSKISGGKYTGGLVGYIGYVPKPYCFVNCVVDKCEFVSGIKPVGGILGYSRDPITVIGSSVTNNTFDDKYLEDKGEGERYAKGAALIAGRLSGDTAYVNYANCTFSGNTAGGKSVEHFYTWVGDASKNTVEEITSGAVIAGKGTYENFTDAVAAADDGDTIYVIGTVKPTGDIEIQKNITISGGTFDVSDYNNGGEGFFSIGYWEPNGTGAPVELTLDNVNVIGSQPNGFSTFRVQSTSKLTINGGKINVSDVNPSLFANNAEGGTLILNGVDIDVKNGARLCSNVTNLFVNKGTDIYAELDNNAFRNTGMTVTDANITIKGCEYGVKNTKNGYNLIVVGDSKIDITTMPARGGMTYYMSNGAYIDTSKATSTDPLCQNKSTGRIDGESANKAAQAAGFTTEEGTTSTIDVLTVSGSSVSDKVTFEYEIDYNGKKYPVGAEFDTTGTEAGFAHIRNFLL